MARAAGYPKFRPDPPPPREIPIRGEPGGAWQPYPHEGQVAAPYRQASEF
jgi:hypothetical protein